MNAFLVDRVMMFGFDCLRISGKVFAKMHEGQVVVKLPAKRIASLIAVDSLHPYDRGGGRWMKEWAVVESLNVREIIPLLAEARAFTAGG